MVRPLLAFTALGAALSLVACSSATPPPSAVDPKEPVRAIGARCPTGPEPGEERLDPPQVLTEMVLLDAPAGPPLPGPSIDDIVKDPRVTVLTSPHILGTSGVASTMDVPAPGGPPGSTPDTLKVTLLPKVEANGDVRLGLTITRGGAEPPMQTTLVTRDQQLVVIGGEHGERSLVAVVIPYVVRAKSDLRRLYECKLAQRAAAR